MTSLLPLISSGFYSFRIENQSEFPENHVMHKLGPSSIGHLTPDHVDYFSKWFLLSQLELAAASAGKLALKRIWRRSSLQRFPRLFAYEGKVL